VSTRVWNPLARKDRSGAQPRLNPDFWKFWTGQAISTLGTSFTVFALPLLVYKLTGSALNLGLTTAAEMLPYLFFGLIIGAWVDRLDRKRLMIVVDLLLGATIATVPALYALGHLSIWYIYAAGFVGSTLFIFFNSAEYAAIPSLVPTEMLVQANGRIEASYSAMQILGPLLAGALSAFVALPDLLLIDAFSYLVSAGALLMVRTSFNQPAEEQKERTTVRQDIVEGLRYVLGHPVLRNISLMMALVNFFATTIGSTLIYFAKHQLHAPNSGIGILFSAGAAGTVVISLLAGPLRKRWSFSRVALTALAIDGALTVVLAFTPWLVAALFVWALMSGAGLLFNINTRSLRQAIVPNHLLGRVMSVAGVLAWSAIPLGALLGGIAIDRTGNVVLVYAVIGVITCALPILFSFTALGHADDYIPAQQPAPEEAESLAG